MRRRVAAMRRRMAFFQADLADRAQRSTVIHRVVEHFGRLDILVNCAGIQHRQPAMEFDLDRWDADPQPDADRRVRAVPAGGAR